MHIEFHLVNVNGSDYLRRGLRWEGNNNLDF